MVLVADYGIFRLADTLDMDLLCASELAAMITLSDWTTFLFNFIEGAIRVLARRRAMTLDAGFAMGCSQRGRGDKRRKGHTRHTSCHRRGPGVRLEDGQKTACYMRTMAVIGDCWGRDRENGADICLDDAGRRTPAHQRRWGVRYWNTKRAMSGSCWGWDITAGKGRREKTAAF